MFLNMHLGAYIHVQEHTYMHLFCFDPSPSNSTNLPTCPILKLWKSTEGSGCPSVHLGHLPAHSPFELDLGSSLLHFVPRLHASLWPHWALTSLWSSLSPLYSVAFTQCSRFCAFS